MTATKQKEPKEEPVDNSPSKPTATGPARGTPTSKSSKAKRKANEEAKPSVSVPPKKVKTENVSHCLLLASLIMRAPFIIIVALVYLFINVSCYENIVKYRIEQLSWTVAYLRYIFFVKIFFIFVS